MAGMDRSDQLLLERPQSAPAQRVHDVVLDESADLGSGHGKQPRGPRPLNRVLRGGE